jgi:hypothetical protein
MLLSTKAVEVNHRGLSNANRIGRKFDPGSTLRLRSLLCIRLSPTCLPCLKCLITVGSLATNPCKNTRSAPVIISHYPHLFAPLIRVA